MDARTPLTPGAADLAAWSDKYFLRTKETVGRFGDRRVTYAVFMRRPVVSAPRLAIDWLRSVMESRGAAVEIDLRQEEGKWVGAGEPLMYVTGPLYHLVDAETMLLQKIGPACVAAWNAYAIARSCRRSPSWRWTPGTARGWRWPS